MTLLESRIKEVGNGVLVGVPIEEYIRHMDSEISLKRWIEEVGHIIDVAVLDCSADGFMSSSDNLKWYKYNGYTNFVSYSINTLPCKILP